MAKEPRGGPRRRLWRPKRRRPEAVSDEGSGGTYEGYREPARKYAQRLPQTKAQRVEELPEGRQC